MTNGFHIRGIWICPDCTFKNVTYSSPPPYICLNCGTQFLVDKDIEEDEED